MAKFIGTAGGFQEDSARQRRLRTIGGYLTVVMVAVFVLGWASGLVCGRRNLWSYVPITVAGVILFPVVKWFERLFDRHFRACRAEEDGADGEREVAKFLENLPDTYTVVCDLDFVGSHGNIDHLVLGPTGVFAIDVKNWRGNVAADDKGELLHNGHPTGKPFVRQFIARTMDLRDRIKALTGHEVFIQCVFVFTRSWVEARWGSTGAVHCIRAEQMCGYVTGGRAGKTLPPSDLALIIKAVQGVQAIVQPGDAKVGMRRETIEPADTFR